MEPLLRRRFHPRRQTTATANTSPVVGGPDQFRRQASSKSLPMDLRTRAAFCAECRADHRRTSRGVPERVRNDEGEKCAV